MKFSLPQWKKHFPTFGLDVSGQTLRAVVCHRHHGKRFAVKAIAEKPLPHGLVINGLIQDTKRFAELLQVTIEEAGKHRFPKYLIACLPNEYVYLLTVTLPQSDLSDLRESIRWETAQHVPYPVDELAMDWLKIGEHGNETTFQVAAAPKTIMDSYAVACESAGFYPVGFESSALSIIRTLRIRLHTTSLVVVLGDTMTTVVLVTQNGFPVTLSSAAFCGDFLLKTLTEQLKLKSSEAKKALAVCGFDSTASQGVVRHALLPSLRELLDAIERGRHYLQQLNTHALPSEIFLTGPWSAIKALPEEVYEKTKLPVRLNPLIDFSIPTIHGHPIVAKEDIPAFSAALGSSILQL